MEKWIFYASPLLLFIPPERLPAGVCIQHLLLLFSFPDREIGVCWLVYVVMFVQLALIPLIISHSQTLRQSALLITANANTEKFWRVKCE